jgi:hypothetical protein
MNEPEVKNVSLPTEEAHFTNIVRPIIQLDGLSLARWSPELIYVLTDRMVLRARQLADESGDPKARTGR